MHDPNYGQSALALSATGLPVRVAAFDEHQVRAAAGLTLVLGAVAFAYAFLAREYRPIQTVTVLFFVEFAMRVLAGIHRSPLGIVAGWMVRHRRQEWVPAQPKRFAWTLGLVMSLAMSVITNAGIRGPLPLSICLVCLLLMWMETALGLCVGCWMHGRLARRGWVGGGAGCAGGRCTPEPRR